MNKLIALSSVLALALPASATPQSTTLCSNVTGKVRSELVVSNAGPELQIRRLVWMIDGTEYQESDVTVVNSQVTKIAAPMGPSLATHFAQVATLKRSNNMSFPGGASQLVEVLICRETPGS